ncbi:MAG: dethiobiotin synthase, partial [Pirellulales bacterium]|nr:dethiobiotin synthase [Pirellulales bacterium]
EGRGVGVYKPAASGCRRVDGTLVSDDAVDLWNAAGRPGKLEKVCPQRFEAPLAPHLAARTDGRQLDSELLRRGLDYWTQRSEIVLVEGAGGLMSPLGEEEYVADLAGEFGFPLLVVAPNVLGTINQTIQTVIAAGAFCAWNKEADPSCRNGPEADADARRWSARKWGPSPYSRGELAIAGIVLNHPAPPSTADASVSTNRRELETRCLRPVLGEVAWGAERLDPPVNWFDLAG